MFKAITRNDRFISKKTLQKDKTLFNMLFLILEDVEKYPTPKIFSNNKDCLLVQSDSSHPVIVWTDEGYSDFANIFVFLQKEHKNEGQLKIISKPAFYDFLMADKSLEIGKKFNVGAYECLKLNDIDYFGSPDNIKPEEVEIVANLIRDFHIEVGVGNTPSMQDNIETAKRFIIEPDYKVLRDENGKIVCMAYCKGTKTQSRISGVMTPKEERGKGYAKSLVHYLTKYLLDNNRSAALYTDMDYASSNKCYAAIGYKFAGQLINSSIDMK